VHDVSICRWVTTLGRVLSDEELRVLRMLRKLSKPKRKLGYMRKLYVLKK